MDALGIILSDNDQVAAPQFYALLFWDASVATPPK